MLSVRDLGVTFKQGRKEFKAVREISFDLAPGESIGLVGESGSGKSVTSLAVLGLLNRNHAEVTGEILFQGTDLLKIPEPEMRKIRGRKIAAIFQDPLSSLNPVLRIGEQIAESLRTHLSLSKAESLQRARELLEIVEIPNSKERLRSYPHELSGGMRQRVMIAIAISCNPDLLIADEPTTALDATIQSQILKTLQRLRKETRMGMLLISHDLGVVAENCDRVMVAYAGRIVESAPTHELIKSGRHPYTEALISARPRFDTIPLSPLPTIDGIPPDSSSTITGCAFAPRCKIAVEQCISKVPPITNYASKWDIACGVRQKPSPSIHQREELDGGT